MAHGFSTHRIHVYIHLVDFDGKCRYARMIWGMFLFLCTSICIYLPGPRKGARCTVRLCQSKTRQLEILISYKCCLYIPQSIHGTGIFTYISLMCTVNVGKYIIHGWYGYKNALTISICLYMETCSASFLTFSEVSSKLIPGIHGKACAAYPQFLGRHQNQ